RLTQIFERPRKNEDGSNVHLDFSNAFFTFKTEISTRQKYIDEQIAKEVLKSALANFKNKK
ncbi:hypothetical protein DS2_19121, partial [Catenovulum agarivorans DS-2]